MMSSWWLFWEFTSHPGVLEDFEAAAEEEAILGVGTVLDPNLAREAIEVVRRATGVVAAVTGRQRRTRRIPCGEFD